MAAPGVGFGTSAAPSQSPEAVLTLVLNPVAATRGSDQTAPADYHFEPAQPIEASAPISATA